MASEETGEPVAVDVPDEVRWWLQRTADERGVSVEALVRELVSAHRILDAGDLEDVDGVGGADASGTVPDVALEDRLETLLEHELADVRAEFRELLEDVRGRVVQVKRETDGKAPAEHDHGDLREAVDALGEEVTRLADDLADRREELASLREDVDGGFENFESVLEYQVETTDDLLDRVDRLARATLDARDLVQDVAGSVRTRERADALKRDAALEGIAEADCEDCGRTVRAALLTAPECPYCAAGFVDVEGKRGLFGSAIFRTGELPALARGDGDDLASRLQADLDADRPEPGAVDWNGRGGEDR